MAVMCLEGVPWSNFAQSPWPGSEEAGRTPHCSIRLLLRDVIAAAAAAARDRPHVHPTNTRPAGGTGTLPFSPENRVHVSGLAVLGAGASDWESHASVDCRLTGKVSFWLRPVFLLRAEFQVTGQDSEAPSSLHSDTALTLGTLTD